MSDIVERLRDRAHSFKSPDRLSEEAADVIEMLQVRLARLEEKLTSLSTAVWRLRAEDKGE